ncbi:Translocation and assembly module subunit TamB [Pseudoalteromonas holothuriae]|uniref:Translocation and assembly module subunit TamB n=1 Tax=Pseudoalteromonas holothuriae TaxID=2963714 RepID=A0ABM9GKQ9_9GAMM|nr:translocation/assembly module TamB domain-containing protein [Pseudoalteromonas sp. CIP111951]CAH9063857.1 Translocation and assembly module subunit TamB [Pseudoalteromonas sp. CIP111951]
MLFSARLKKGLSGIAAIAVVVFCIIATAPGHQLLVYLANKTVSGLELKLAEGRLLSGTQIDMTYKNEQVSISAQQLRVSLEWFSCATLCIDVSGESIQVKAGTLAEESQQPVQESKRINAPVHLGIRNLSVRHFEADFNGQHVSFSQLHSQLQWQDEQLLINKFTLDSVHVTLPDEQTEQTKALPEKIPALVFKAPFIPMNVTAQKLRIQHFELRQASQTTKLDNIAIEASLDTEQLQWQTLNADMQDFKLRSQGAVFWSESLQLNSSTVLKRGDDQLLLDTNGSLSKLAIKLNSMGQYPSDVEGNINLAQDNWPFDVQLLVHDWQFSGLLPAPFERLKLEQGKFDIEGDFNDYVAKLSINGNSSPESPFSSSAKLHGSLTEVTIDDAQLQWREAVAAFSTQFSWQQGINGEVIAEVTQIPLTLFLPQYPDTKLNTQLAMSFAINDGQWQTDIKTLELDGVLLNKPLTAATKLQLNQDFQGNLEQFSFAYGQSKVTLSGLLGQQLQLSGNVNLAHSADLLLPADIEMSSDIVVSGNHKTPSIELHADLQHVRYQQVQLIDAQLDFFLDGASRWETDAKLQASRIEVEQQAIQNATVSVQGDLLQHTLEIKTQGDALVDVKLRGSLQNEQWQAVLTDAKVDYQQYLFELLEPAQIYLSQQEAKFDKQCWVLLNSEACFSGQQNIITGHGHGDVKISQLLLSDINPWLGDITKLDGSAFGGVSFDWQSGKLTKADGKLQFQHTQVITTEGDVIHTLPIETLNTQLVSSEELATLDWQIESSLLGRLQGEMQLPLIGKAKPKAIVEIVHMSLSPLSPVLSKSLHQPFNLAGDISGKVNLTGDLRSPHVAGQVNIKEIALASPVSPITLMSSSVDITFDAKQANIHGNMQAEQGGTLSLDGQLSWANKLAGKIKAQGDNFLIAPEANVEVSISPDILFEYSENKASVTGKLFIPFGRIEVKEIPVGVVQVSEDQIIVDAQSKRLSRSPIDYKVDIDVQVGDDFRVKALGLDSYIAGRIDVVKMPASPLLASGELSLNEGRYRAFGQDLLIKTGLIGFNGALDKPYLNVRAIRNPEVTANDVEAGIELSGSISKPSFSVYSQPAMDQSQALAYLLNGEPLGEGESSNNTILTQLLLSQGLNRSEGLVAKTGEKLGFSDVSLGARGSGDSTKVEVSGYLTPSVQVSYRVGVFDSLSEVAVRYRVFSKLYIEATSGLYDSVDLLYKFDWDN